jgi:hypothetical protein
MAFDQRSPSCSSAPRARAARSCIAGAAASGREPHRERRVPLDGRQLPEVRRGRGDLRREEPGDLPVDAHELIALCAPRHVLELRRAPSKATRNGSTSAAASWRPSRRSPCSGCSARATSASRTTMRNAEPPAVNVGLLDGELAWRQHEGGHTTRRIGSTSSLGQAGCSAAERPCRRARAGSRAGGHSDPTAPRSAGATRTASPNNAAARPRRCTTQARCRRPNTLCRRQPPSRLIDARVTGVTKKGSITAANYAKIASRRSVLPN